jgi:hypothetical protein
MSELEKLKAQNAELSDRIAKLEEAAKPPEPFVPEPWQPIDRTAGMSMDRASMLRMAAVDTSGLQADRRAFQQQPRAASSPAEPQVKRGTGWQEPRPLESPPGVHIADQLMDEADRRDRAELIERLAKAAAIEKAAKEKTSGPTDDDAGR